MAANWLASAPNPFSLATPPAFFLRDLAAYDPELVLFPSQESGVYRIARRKKLAPGQFAKVKAVREMFGRRPDTQVMAQHGLIGVGTLLPSSYTHWGPHLVKELSEKDAYELGGYTRVADSLDEADELRTVRQLREQNDGIEDRAKPAYDHIQYREGHRVFISGDEAKRLSADGATAPV